ncbi:hypothetical protein CVU82_03395 [Candidatus Falkowbacteria bacterium HGW-Falkowbacteria-1]|jgi:hypothetical protein|uniref:Uncharacterized protein n=1 Tax=Candidatus Falkowbacteria bacterium HGW-Falkowbacteria-1 TaxID=2013768 RepID=A0A2N2E8N8_9BACT|nr:MAG: hypothetical protein CVU82_03395 [Candidatus Falkowbacteria bacterium HGW-Falkowbacteria-1]
MNNNFFFYLSKISISIIWDIVYFPLWWYSVGFWRFLKTVASFLNEQWIIIGAGAWINNLFTPMYGQRDFTGRAISFFVRIFQIIFRFIAFIFFIMLSLVAIIFWLLAPVTVVYLLVTRIFT